MEIAGQPALSRYCVRGRSSCRRRARQSDMRAFIRRHAQTLYHPVGTCAMGPDEDAVVDLELRVRGVEGLRVVDASVMPTVHAATRTRPRSRSPSARRT